MDGLPGALVTTTGGAPTKALREAALYLTGHRQDEVYGVRAAAPLEVVMPTLRARIEHVRDVLQDVVADQLAARRIDYRQGTARLGRDRTVSISSPDAAERQVAAGAVLVATGSRPMHPAGIPFDDPDVYDSDQIYSIPRPPENIVIIGGGPEGVEFASAFTALGVPVTQQPIDEADQHGRRTGRADGRRVTPTYSYAYHDATLDGLTRLTEMMGLADGTATMPADTPKATRTDTPKAMAPTPPE